VIEFPETASRRTWIAMQNIAQDSDYIYVITHNGYTGAPDTLIKFSKRDFTYTALNLGSGFLSGAPMVIKDNYIIAACGVSNSYFRLFVIDKNTLEILRAETIEYQTPAEGFTTTTDVFLRNDGGLTVCYLRMNHKYNSARNKYVINFNPVNDWVNDPLTRMNEFHLGAFGRIKQTSDKIIYKPYQYNALINRDNFRFVLYTYDDTLQTLKYGDGTDAPVPFTPDAADYSKVNTILNDAIVYPPIDIIKNNIYYLAGNNLNNYATYSFYDLNMNIVKEHATNYSNSCFIFYGSTEYLMMWKDYTFKLYRIDDGTIEDITGSYSWVHSTTMAMDNRFLYLFDAGSNYSVGRVSIFDITNLHITPPAPKYLYPFWYGGK